MGPISLMNADSGFLWLMWWHLPYESGKNGRAHVMSADAMFESLLHVRTLQ